MTDEDMQGYVADRLKSVIENIEKLEETKKDITEDIKDVYEAAKGSGFDVPTIKKIVKIRKMTKEQLQEQESLLDLYKSVLGIG